MPQNLDNVICNIENTQIMVKPLYYYNLLLTFTNKSETSTTKMCNLNFSIVTPLVLNSPVNSQQFITSLWEEAGLSTNDMFYFNGAGNARFISQAKYYNMFDVYAIKKSSTIWDIYYSYIDNGEYKDDHIQVDNSNDYVGMMKFTINNKIPLFAIQ